MPPAATEGIESNPSLSKEEPMTQILPAVSPDGERSKSEASPMPSKLLAPFTNPWQTLSLPMLSGDALFQSEPVTDAIPPLGERLLPAMSVPAPPLDDAASDTWTDQMRPVVEMPPQTLRDQVSDREIGMKARDDVAEIMGRLGISPSRSLPLNRAPIMVELTSTSALDDWIAQEVDAIEARITEKRGPYIPLLDFLAEPEPGTRPSPRRVEKVHVDRDEPADPPPADPPPADPPVKPPVKRRPSPRPRKTAPKADVA